MLTDQSGDPNAGSRPALGARSLSVAGQTTSEAGLGPSPHHIDLAHRAKWLRTNGVDTPAHIDAMASTGITDKPGRMEYMIRLTVSPAGGDAYAVTTNQYVYPSAPLSEGQDVTVRVDPDDRDVVMIFGNESTGTDLGFAQIPA